MDRHQTVGKLMGQHRHEEKHRGYHGSGPALGQSPVRRNIAKLPGYQKDKKEKNYQPAVVNTNGDPKDFA
jgi:hypothetical protein